MNYSMDFILPLITGVLAVIMGVLFQLTLVRIRKKRVAIRELPTGERIQQSISKLSSASQEIDDIIQGIVKDIKNRQTAFEELKTRHQILSKEEEELTKRVEILKDVPVEAAKYFQQISEDTLQQAERRRAKRDITMFFLGIIVTTAIAILLRVL